MVINRQGAERSHGQASGEDMFHRGGLHRWLPGLIHDNHSH
jgi:hypothetical protein